MSAPDDRTANLWTDPHGPIVFSTVGGMPSSHAGFVDFCRREIELIRSVKKNFSAAYSIMDLSGCQPVPLNIAIDYAGTALPQQVRHGMRFKALIKPANPLTQTVLETAFARADSSRIAWFNSFEEALADINRRLSEWKVDRRGRFNKALFGLATFLNL